MTDTQPETASDVWSRWLLHTRHGDDPELDRIVREELEPYASRVLDGARLEPGMTLADIGTGEGLIAFRAIDRIGPSLRVVLTDISAPMLRHTEALADQRGVRQQCTFIECAADNLAEIPDTSVDVVTTRAVLAYVADKGAALREFHRILKPGGRISLAEPIFQDDAVATCALKNLAESKGPGELKPLWTLLHRWKAAQFPDTPEKLTVSPIANYTERMLFEWIRTTGFEHIHVEFHIDLFPSRIKSWQAFIDSSPHPWAPTLSDILAEQFSAAERQLLETTLRPLVESGKTPTIVRTAYVTAVKESLPG